MRYSVLLFYALFVFGAVRVDAQIPVQIPGSDRSAEAVARVAPGLQSELLEAGFDWRPDRGRAVFIRIFKTESALEVWLERDDGFRLFKTYRICRWSGDLGPKLREGDRQSPEGFYAVTPDAMNPESDYHLSFNLGFPNAYDAAHGRTGSLLMVHGDCWSVGCYAMATRLLPLGANRNRPIEELWTLMVAAFEAGQPVVPVHIFPFRMTDRAMARHASSPWIGFWRELKGGHDWFERHRRPPSMRVVDGRYLPPPG